MAKRLNPFAFILDDRWSIRLIGEQIDNSVFQDVEREARYGASEAEYNMCRKLTTTIVNTITNPGAASRTNSVVTNCDDPSKTIEDIICEAALDKPAFNANAP